MVALLVSVGTAVAVPLVASLVGTAIALRVAVMLCGLAYLVYLLARADARAGRVVMLGLWLLVSAGVAVLDPPFAAHVVAQLGLAWIARAVWFHRGVLAALTDLGLVGLALAAGVWAAERTGSFVLSVWCVLLVQAAFVAIPRCRSLAMPQHASDDEPGVAFRRAHRAAEAALGRLAAR